MAATRVGAETQLAQMARLVTDAQNGKAPVQRLAEPTVSPRPSCPPLICCESMTRGGEDVSDEDGKEAGRHDQGTEGLADRPVTSDSRDTTGI